MKKSILNLGKILNKIEQKEINGGMFGGTDCGGPICYGVSNMNGIPCGTCTDWRALPQDCKNGVLVHTDCTY